MASVSDATGATVDFDYDAVGNLNTTTAPDGDVYRNIFDNVGRLTARRRPDRRDRLRRRTTVADVSSKWTDPLGNTWRRDVRHHEQDQRVDCARRHGDPLGITTLRAMRSRSPGLTGGNGVASSITRADRSPSSTRPVDAPPSSTPPPGASSHGPAPPGGPNVSSTTSPAGFLSIVGIDGVRREASRDDRGRIESMVALDASGTPSNTVEYRWDDGSTASSE